MKSTRTHRESGFTLIELLISLGVMATIVGGSWALLSTTSQNADATARLSVVSGEANRVLERIVTAVMPSSLDQLAARPEAPSGSDSLTFRRATGYLAGVVQYGDEVEIARRYDPKDPDDGIDNDGDGLVDEGEIIYRLRPGDVDEQVFVWASNVAEYLAGETPNAADDNGNGLFDERGLSFCVENGALVIRVTILGRGADGTIFSRLAETSIMLRN